MALFLRDGDSIEVSIAGKALPSKDLSLAMNFWRGTTEWFLESVKTALESGGRSSSLTGPPDGRLSSATTMTSEASDRRDGEESQSDVSSTQMRECYVLHVVVRPFALAYNIDKPHYR